jgi:exonuclease III
MKIVTWNCNGALRKKTSELDKLDADVYVVQECEDPAESTLAYREWAGDYLWKGQNKNKGVGVFPRKGNRVQDLRWNATFNLQGLTSKSTATQWTTDELEIFLPFKLNDWYTIVAVWTKGGDDKVFGYIGQAWKFLQLHKGDIDRDRSIMMGDFNSNAIWDKPDRWWNHSDVVSELREIGLESLYHALCSDPQGQEKAPTLFLQRNLAKPYHVDYVFASSMLMPLCTLDIGKADEWLRSSDHMPLTLTIENSIKK